MCKIGSFSISGTAHVIKMKLGVDIKYITVCHVCQFCSAVLNSRGDNWCALKFVRNLNVGAFSETMVPSQLKLGMIITTTELYPAIPLLVTFDLYLGHRVGVCAK